MGSDWTEKQIAVAPSLESEKNLQCFSTGEQQKEKEGSQGSSDGSRRERRHDRIIAGERKERVEQSKN